jgi:hypothetical protein
MPGITKILKLVHVRDAVLEHTLGWEQRRVVHARLPRRIHQLVRLASLVVPHKIYPNTIIMSGYCQSGTLDGDCVLIKSLYDNINNNLEAQNAQLEAQSKKISSVYSTDYQKSNYQNTNVMQYKFINSILFWFYYILVLVIAFKVVPSNMSRAIKALIIGAFVVYPFVINNIMILLYGVLKYMYALVSGTVYIPPEY